ncbi:MAG: hypothetical protein FJX52_01195 [Alphaproteobacteria bacterium]|nr:hypothetical protein [Alphaproteobacteria bacterium]
MANSTPTTTRRGFVTASGLSILSLHGLWAGFGAAAVTARAGLLDVDSETGYRLMTARVGGPQIDCRGRAGLGGTRRRL